MLELVNLPNGACLEVDLEAPLSIGRESKLAICLHPWSWLGGQMDDPWVSLASSRQARAERAWGPLQCRTFPSGAPGKPGLLYLAL